MAFRAKSKYHCLSAKNLDHEGGTLWLLEQNPNIIVYLPKTWNNNLEKSLPIDSKQIHIVKNNYPINETFHLIISKNLWINELALGVKSLKGIIAITGYGHIGILKITKTMSLCMKNKIHALLGGFHLLRSSKSKIENIVNSFLKRIKKRVNNLKDENILIL